MVRRDDRIVIVRAATRDSILPPLRNCNLGHRPPPSVGFGSFVEQRDHYDNPLVPARRRSPPIDRVVDRRRCRRQRGHRRSVGWGSRHGLIRRRRACPFCRVAVPSLTTSKFVERCRHITLILVVILFVVLVVVLVIVAIGIGRRIAVRRQRRKTDDETAATTNAVGRSTMTEDEGRRRRYLPPPIPPSAVHFLWGRFLSGRARRSKSLAAYKWWREGRDDGGRQ